MTFCVHDKPDAVGGPVTWVQRLLPSLRDRGLEVRCLFLLHWGQTGPALTSLQSQGIECDVCVASENTADRVKWILERVQDHQPDVFVPNLVVAGYFAARWLRKAGIPSVAVLHSDDAFYRAIQSDFVHGAEAYRVSAVVAVSDELQRQVERHSATAVHSRKIPYGVPIPEARTSGSSDAFRVAYVGRLVDEQKRISDVARVFCRAVSELPDLEATIFGDGPDMDRVRQIVATDTTGRVAIAGAVSPGEIQREMLETDIIVLLSDYEGLPIALMEAMACGCIPVCVPMRSGIPELVQHDVTGLIVDNRDGAVIAAMRRLRDDDALRTRLSFAARDLIASRFALNGCADQWHSLLEDIAKRGTNRKPISVPRRIHLPRRNPALEGPQQRSQGPSRVNRLLGRARMAAGRLRRLVNDRFF